MAAVTALIEASEKLYTVLTHVDAHELTHLEHPNHTAAFWAALGRAMPDYDARKARLRLIGPELEW